MMVLPGLGDSIGLSTTMYPAALFYGLSGIAALLFARRVLVAREAAEEMSETQPV